MTRVEEQHAVIGGRTSVRRYLLYFDNAPARGPGTLVNSSMITDSWGMRPRLDSDSSWRRTLDWYSIVYVFRGQGTYYGSEGPRPLVAGDIICLFPGVAHAYGPAADARWDEINISFVGPAFDAWRGPGLLDPAEPIRHLAPTAYWKHRIEELVHAVSLGTSTNRLHWVGRMVELISHMTADWQPDIDKSAAEWLEAVKDRLNAAADASTFDYHRLASEFDSGEQAFRKRFRSLTGMTPAQYRARRLIERACLLLEQTDATSRALASQLGFESEFYFSRRFKQLVGVPPREYRRRVGHGGAASIVEHVTRGEPLRRPAAASDDPPG